MEGPQRWMPTDVMDVHIMATLQASESPRLDMTTTAGVSLPGRQRPTPYHTGCLTMLF